MKVVLDTNILIDYLNGIEQGRQEIERYDQAMISAITWMEILVGATDEEETIQIRRFLKRFNIIPIDESVSELAVTVRRKYKIRLPDAIIWASAKYHDALLVTCNTRDFPIKEADIRIPYQL